MFEINSLRDVPVNFTGIASTGGAIFLILDGKEVPRSGTGRSTWWIYRENPGSVFKDFITKHQYEREFKEMWEAFKDHQKLGPALIAYKVG